MSKVIQAKDAIHVLNAWKEERIINHKPCFSKKEFIKIWRDSGLPIFCELWEFILEFKVIIKCGKNKYTFDSLTNTNFSLRSIQCALDNARSKHSKVQRESTI